MTSMRAVGRLSSTTSRASSTRPSGSIQIPRTGRMLSMPPITSRMDANQGARRLYERCGYRAAAERVMVKEGWENAGVTWMLLLKPLRDES